MPAEHSQPDTRIHDKDMALDMAYAAKPHWENALAAKQAADLAMQAAFESYVPPAQTAAETEVVPADQEAKAINPKRLSEIVHDSAFAVNTAMNGHEVPYELLGGSVRNGFMILANNESVRRSAVNSTYTVLSARGEQTAVNLLGSFVDAGVSELVTVSEINAPFKKVRPDSPKADEPIVGIAYEPLYAQGAFRNQKYQAASHDGRPGNQLQVRMILPKSSADELLAAVKTDPTVIRDAVDALMRQEVQATDSWDGPHGVRPLYEKWDEVNGGVNRIALRSDIAQGPEASDILEF